MSVETNRPHRTSMDGMIWHANHILGYALHPGIRGVPKGLFMECAGIAIMSVVDAGCIFSGTVGTGILMAHNEDGSWSAPIACGLTGVGFGILLGIAAKELIIFLPDKASLTTFLSSGIQLTGKSDITLGVGREFQGTIGFSKTGSSVPLTFAYTKGAFAAAALETAVVAPRKKVNMYFYENHVELMDIIDGKVKYPEDKKTLWPDVVEKLRKLSDGLSELPSDQEKEKAEAAYHAANEAAESYHKTEEEEIVVVDAEAEAAKEAS
ncbi:hypothetical protein ACA910_019441 [Epithemia clementina (nom. ined.)]